MWCCRPTRPPGGRSAGQLAQAHGFDYVWTFDSHLLWQEPYVSTARSFRTNRVVVGPMVTNPATRDWTVTASVFATLNEMFGNRTVCGIGRGDSAVRVTNGKPTTVREMREATHVILGLANCRPVDYKGSHLQFPWARTSALEVWVAAYGPRALKAAGEVGDGYILELADLDIACLDDQRLSATWRPRGRPGPGGDHLLRGCARCTSGTDLAHMRDQCRWFGGMVGNHVADIVAKYGEPQRRSRRR